MKTMKSAYELDAKGNIVSYDANLDTERFSFLSKEDSAFDKMLYQVNSLLNSMLLKKEYQIDWNEVVDQYKLGGIGDVPHFASQYVHSKYRLTGMENRSEVLEAMYLEITRSINQEIEKGNLPSSYDQL
ncbi:MAG: hypothetical protein AAGF77_04470 [Bacteroidota bacterium]